MKTATISKHLGSLIVIGVMLITAPSTIAFAGRIFGWDSFVGALRSTLLIFLTEVVLLAWHRASKALARGESQHSITAAMTWVSLAGVVSMAGIEIGLEFAERTHAESVDGLVGTLSVVGVVVLVLLLALNLAAGIGFMNADPDHVQRRNEERLQEAAQAVQDELTAKTVETVRRQMHEKRDELMSPRVDAILVAMMDKQHLLAKLDAKRLLQDADIIDGVAKPVERPRQKSAPAAADQTGRTVSFAKDQKEAGVEGDSSPKQ